MKPETVEDRVKQDKKDAVNQKQFGPLTRQKFTWHPHKYLCKFFNVEDPYPDSREEGCPDLVKKTTKKDYDLDMLGLPSTEKDLVDKIVSVFKFKMNLKNSSWRVRSKIF